MNNHLKMHQEKLIFLNIPKLFLNNVTFCNVNLKEDIKLYSLFSNVNVFKYIAFLVVKSIDLSTFFRISSSYPYMLLTNPITKRTFKNSTIFKIYNFNLQINLKFTCSNILFNQFCNKKFLITKKIFHNIY
jgi:hypothetical protein